jgi:hypothetical protein
LVVNEAKILAIAQRTAFVTHTIRIKKVTRHDVSLGDGNTADVRSVGTNRGLAPLSAGNTAISCHPSMTVNVVQASAAATARSQTVQIVSTFTQRGEPPSTSRLVYDYQHHRGASFPLAGSGEQPDVIFDGSKVYLSLPETAGGLLGVKLSTGYKHWLINNDT